MRTTLIFSFLAATSMAACTPAENDSTAPQLDLPQNCGAEKLQGLIGMSKTALENHEFEPGTRLIGPEDAITADYSPDRLNIEFGPDGNVSKVACY